MSSLRSYDVVVVGAGPAGSSSAFVLARQGVRVALVEKAPMPRYKTCGGGIVSRALRLLPFDVSDAIERQCHVAELNLADAGMYFSVARDYPLVSMTMRDNFDYLLYRAAATAGADVVDGCRVLDVVRHNGTVEVVTDKYPLICRFVIGADGGRSIVARKAGWKNRTKVIPLVEWEVPVNEDLLETFSRSARFEFGPVPAGYAWIFPKKHHLSVGLGSYDPGRLSLRSTLQQFLSQSGIKANGGAEHHGYFIPVGLRKGGFAKGRVLLAGDAAGFIDPVTGEGITHAVMSGQSAARAVVKGDFRPEDVKESYYSELRKSILPELRWARFLAAILYGSGKIRNLLFRQYGQELAEAVTDIIVGEKSYGAVCKKHAGLRQLVRMMKGMVNNKAPRET
jgi:geranylgeranyl reductase family protein